MTLDRVLNQRERKGRRQAMKSFQTHLGKFEYSLYIR